MAMRILVADKLAAEGLDFLKQSGMQFDEKVGLKEGDKIVEFDGTRAADMSPTVFRGAAARAKPVKVVVNRDGKRLEFVIEPYLVP